MTGPFVTRSMTVDDIATGVRLCRLSHWNQMEEDWATFLELSPNGCRVIEIDRTVAGTVATLRFAEQFSWVAMVLVDPAMRGRGIGTALLLEALGLLKNEKCVRLDATQFGERIYRAQGFREEYRLNRLVAQGHAKHFRANGDSCTPMGSDDLKDVFRLDRRVYGADRSALLRSFFRRAPEYAWIRKTGSSLAGYIFGRHGYNHEQLGPIVSDAEETAMELVSCCMARHQTTSFVIDVPANNLQWNQRLQNFGFALERSFVRMYYGSRVETEEVRSQFAIAGPEFG